MVYMENFSILAAGIATLAVMLEHLLALHFPALAFDVIDVALSDHT